MADMMAFPDTVEEFMEQYKITDTDHVYTNGADMVPIFRMKQWFEHQVMAQMSVPDCISRNDFDKCLEDAEKEAARNRKYVFASALNTIRGNLRNFPSAQPELIAQGAYVRGFEQGRTQGMLDAKLQPTCNQLAIDCISRQAAIDAVTKSGDYFDMIERLNELPSAHPKWIPCSEHEYPSDNREVEVTCEFTRYDGKKFKYTCHAAYIHRYSVESAGGWEYCDEYNEEKDMYYALPGWYERVHNWDDYAFCAIEDRVVAWRELREPWKGEEHEL